MRWAPKKPGKYWARSNSKCQWWNLIVHIDGETPYLYVSSIVNYHNETMVVDPKHIDVLEIVFGPEIEEPEDPKVRG